MEALIHALHHGKYSCVIANGTKVRTFAQRGVADLYALLKNEPEFLHGASVADKVVGKGAAALMILGGVKEIYTDVISTCALKLLRDNDVRISYATETPSIRNRDNTGNCPVENLCASTNSVNEMLLLIEKFISSELRICSE